MKKLLAMTAIVFSGIFLFGAAQAKESISESKKVEAALRDLMLGSKIKGLLAAYSEPGKGAHKYALGESMNGVPVTKDMHFRMGAPAIAILGTMLLQNVDKKKLSLDDKLNRWFPDIPQSEKISLAMLANSSSGIGDYVQNKQFISDWESNVFKHWRSDELVSYALTMSRDYEPGKGWNYSHTNFILLGEVLARSAKKPFAKLVKEKVLKRLNLKDTEYIETSMYKQPVLHSYSADRGVYEEATYWSPTWSGYSGSYYTSLDDLLRLTKAIGQGRLLSKKSHDAMTAPTVVGLGPLTQQRYYGLGVIVQNGWIMQVANMNGYSNVMAYLPEKKLAIVVSVTRKQGYEDGVDYGVQTFNKLVEVLAPDHGIKN